MRPAAVRLLTVLAAGALLSACGGGGGGSRAPTVLPGATVPDAAARSVDGVTRNAPVPAATTAPPPGCTYIVTKNPATQLDTSRTAKSFTTGSGEDAEESGEHEGERGGRGRLNLDATGCDYGIYLGPKSKHARIRNARIHGAGRAQIVAEGSDDLQITNTATDGGSFASIEFTYGASGSVERSFVTNAFVGIIYNFSSRGLVGETLVTNTSFLGIDITANSNVTVEDTRIDNSMNVGGGVAVQLGANGVLRNVTAIGAGVPNIGIQAGFFFGYLNPHVSTSHLTAINNQYGFISYCVAGINSVTDLTNAHDVALGSTALPYFILTSACPSPP
jgi:parallel beta helix pectate lyase-like protein